MMMVLILPGNFHLYGLENYNYTTVNVMDTLHLMTMFQKIHKMKRKMHWMKTLRAKLRM